MAYGDRINAIKQDWRDDSIEMLREMSGDPTLGLPSLVKMTSGDLSKLHDALDSIKRRLGLSTCLTQWTGVALRMHYRHLLAQYLFAVERGEGNGHRVRVNAYLQEMTEIETELQRRDKPNA